MNDSPEYRIRHLFPKRRPISRSVKEHVWYFTWGQCWYCGIHLNPFYNLHIDHIVPIALGGGDEIENLVPCCKHCNMSKAALSLEEWRKNFEIADELDEMPWDDESGVFFFERHPRWEKMRQQEIRAYHRVRTPRKTEAS